MESQHTLVLECASYALHNRVLQLRRLMNDMEVLSTSLTNKTWVALVYVDVSGDVLPEFLEDECAAGKVEGGEAGVGDDLRADLFRRAGDELDNTRWHAGLLEDLVDDVVGVGRCW